jgi:hypothetical protein
MRRRQLLLHRASMHAYGCGSPSSSKGWSTNFAMRLMIFAMTGTSRSLPPPSRSGGAAMAGMLDNVKARTTDNVNPRI